MPVMGMSTTGQGVAIPVPPVPPATPATPAISVAPSAPARPTLLPSVDIIPQV